MKIHGLCFAAEALNLWRLAAALVLGAAVIVLVTVPMNSLSVLKAMLLALAVTVVWGLPIVSILCPTCTRVERTALVLAVGYVTSILMRFVLAWFGWLDAFLFAGAIFFGIWFVMQISTRRVPFAERFFRAERNTLRTLTQPTIYVLGLIFVLSVWVASPLMMPLQQDSAERFLDFAHRDTHYHLIRAVILSQRVPQYTNPDLAGMLPILYPDFQHAWMGMLMRDTQIDARTIYYQVAPIFLMFATILTLFVIGKTLSNQNLGGYIGAAMVYLIFVPNPWDSNFLLRRVLIYERTSYEMRFYDLQYNLANTAGMLLFSAVFLILLMTHKQRDMRNVVGLLTLGSILVVGLVRVRSNYFVPIAPLYVGYLVWMWFRFKQWRLGTPLLVFGILFALITSESLSGAYDITSAQLALDYGRYGMSLASSFLRWISNAVSLLPAFTQPILYQGLWILGYWFGLFYFLLALLGCIFWFKGREKFTFATAFPLLVLLGTFIAVSFIIINSTTIESGNWGAQALSLSPRVALLLSIMPLYKLISSNAIRIGFFAKYKSILAIGLLLGFAVISYRAANAALYRRAERAYPITQQELTIYKWLQTNTAAQAVIAAHPQHRVNAFGETIRGTNFLSGMTERPAYVQRVLGAAGPRFSEGTHREALLEQLFAARTPQQARTILEQMNFHYLLVYPDKPPQTDLSCCLELIIDGKTKLYFKPQR